MYRCFGFAQHDKLRGKGKMLRFAQHDSIRVCVIFMYLCHNVG